MHLGQEKNEIETHENVSDYCFESYPGPGYFLLGRRNARVILHLQIGQEFLADYRKF